MSNVTSAQNLTVAANLTVGGLTTLSRSLLSSSNATFGQGISTTIINATNNINQSGGSITSGSGGINCNGDMLVIGTSLFSSDVILDSNLDLNGNIICNNKNISPVELSYLDGANENIQNAIDILQDKTTNLNHVNNFDDRFEKNLQIGGNLSITGKTQMNGNDNEINGATKLNANLTILGNLLVTGGASISPTEISYLDGGTQNINTALTTLQSKTANITTTGSITIPVGQSLTGVTKAMIGLDKVDNTTDMNKPVSTLQNNALSLKANLASPTFTGVVSGISKV